MRRNRKSALGCSECKEREPGVVTCVCTDGPKIKGCGKIKPLNEFYQGDEKHKPQCIGCFKKYRDAKKNGNDSSWGIQIIDSGFEVTIRGTAGYIVSALPSIKVKFS